MRFIHPRAGLLAVLVVAAGFAAGPARAQTWHQDVRPILYGHCVSCHTPGGIAPFSLKTYADARPAAGLIATVVGDRRMPPHPADNSGACNRFRDANWLSQDQIDTVVSWSNSAAPEGVPASEPPLAPLLHVDPPDLTVDIGTDYAPLPQNDDYRCFVAQPTLPAGGASVVAFEVVPGEPRVVHHAILFEPGSAQSLATLIAQDGADPTPGYACYGGPGDPTAAWVGSWAPGTGAVHLPPGIGVPLTAGRGLIIQVHYNRQGVGLGAPVSDRSAVRLAFADAPVRPAKVEIVADFALNIPQGETAHVEEATAGLSSWPQTGAWVSQYGRAEIWGLGPHMHELGKSIRVDRVRAGARTCLVDVPRWDFNWQAMYQLDVPSSLEAGDALRIECVFDASSATQQTTTWGFGTSDEMCLAAFYVAPPPAGTPPPPPPPPPEPPPTPEPRPGPPGPPVLLP